MAGAVRRNICTELERMLRDWWQRNIAVLQCVLRSHFQQREHMYCLDQVFRRASLRVPKVNMGVTAKLSSCFFSLEYKPQHDIGVRFTENATLAVGVDNFDRGFAARFSTQWPGVCTAQPYHMNLFERRILRTSLRIATGTH